MFYAFGMGAVSVGVGVPSGEGVGVPSGEGVGAAAEGEGVGAGVISTFAGAKSP